MQFVHVILRSHTAPTRFPTNSPSTELSSVPSTLPSTSDTTLPPSSLPSTSMVSDSPSAAGLLRTSSPSVESTSSSFPSDMPSTQTAIGNGNGNNSSASDDDDSMSNGGIVGITSAAIFITIVFVAYMYRCPSSPSPEMKLSKDPNYFGHEPWGKSGASLPIPYMGLNCSVCSSSSSYRDYRFVNVFGPRGTPIPQFNPNTAGAVVIGSVTIRASSSISSGPFVNSGSHSTKSQSMFTRRKRSHRRHAAPESDSGVSSRDDVSSMSSRRSSYQRSFKHRASNHRRKMTSIRLESRDVDHGAQIPSLGSLKSSRTVPLSHRQRQQMERQLNNSDSLVSFGDWRAATLDMSEGRSFSEPADEAAILAHRKIVFNTLCESTQSLSDDNMTPPSSGCHSLPNLHLIPRAGSSDAGSSSILCKF
jgi:hypothetical protein